jgi:hypothetical protein
VRQYPDIAGSLQHLYLEDSYVLGVRIGGHSLEFELEAVLCEPHELYHPPGPDSYYCFRAGVLKFPDVTKMKWTDFSFPRSIDADDLVDYGNINAFYQEDDGSYYLVGDWGEVSVQSGVPFFTPNP